MDTRTRTITTATESLLQLMWLASPALPVGGFSYSEGLEAAVDAHLVAGETDAARWLVEQLHLTLARAELPIVHRAIRAWRAHDAERVAQLNDWVLRTRETFEMRQQTEQMGRSLVEWIKAVRPKVAARAATGLCYPVAWSLAAADLDVAPRDALQAYAFGWAENMVQAAVRAVPLGQSAGQRVLATLAQEIPAAVDAALTAENEPQAFSPMLAILSARHENQYSRLFRS